MKYTVKRRVQAMFDRVTEIEINEDFIKKMLGYAKQYAKPENYETIKNLNLTIEDMKSLTINRDYFFIDELREEIQEYGDFLRSMCNKVIANDSKLVHDWQYYKQPMEDEYGDPTDLCDVFEDNNTLSVCEVLRIY